MKSILIIEDDKELRRMLKDIFEHNGYKVYKASHGQAGIDLYRKEPAGLVITDINMPGKSGLEVIKELKKEFPSVKIIAISGGNKSTSDDLQAARDLGAIRIMKKPFLPSEILEIVRVKDKT